VVREIDNVDAKIKQTAAALATLNKSKGARSDSQSYRQKKKNLKNELASLKAAKDKFEEEKERLVGESGSTVLLRIPEDWAFEDEDEDEVEVDFGDLY
jgi:seryl-tRNA synthetase